MSHLTVEQLDRELREIGDLHNRLMRHRAAFGPELEERYGDLLDGAIDNLETLLVALIDDRAATAEAVREET
ncbi:MAG TPA: hypothetical protein VD838_23080 [Anaeromyxobacteraceae bacterium]|nr:hypothetical protein [Anaeromyxobacteraceae bacterium]